MMSAATVVDARLNRVVLRKTDPTWRFALGARAESVGLLLELTDSRGLKGFGYTSEIPHLGHHIDILEGVARTHLSPLLSLAVGAKHALVGDPWHPVLPRPVRSMIEMAWWDLHGKANDAPLYQLLGGAPPPAMRVNRILALKTPDETATIAAGLAGDGYDHFKIKMEARPPAADVERVRAVRHAVGPHAVLTVDANQSYDRKGAVALAHRIACYDVAVFEQPVARDDIEGLRYVTDHSPIPVEADESADSLPAVQTLVRQRAVDAVSLKLSKLGGIDALQVAAELCRAHGIGCRIGAHVGSRVMNAAALHAAAAAPVTSLAGELGEFARLDGDPATGLDVAAGCLVIPDGPGLGVTVGTTT